MMFDRKLTLTIVEAAAVLGVSRHSAYAAAQRNELPGAFTIGSRRLVSRPALEAFLANGGKLNLPKADESASR
jgi:excisionase family DNA binding protein